MLGIWPVICLGLFLRLPAPRALLWSVIGGYLLLPSATRFDLQGLPDLDKSSMIAIGAGLGTLIFTRRRVRPAGSWLFYGLGAVFVLSPFGTVYGNPDIILGKNLYFPALTPYDGVSMAGANLFALVPFWAARRLLADEQGHRAILTVLAMAMLAYSLPILFEVRFSPQLHRLVYGFFPHDFSQQIRNGGFRAVVFTSHGLVVALLVSLGLVATLALGRGRARIWGYSARAWAGFLLVVLLLQKSLGAFIMGVVFGLVTLLLRPRRQLTLAALIGALVCVYPVVRGSQVIPVATIEQAVNSFSGDRAASLHTRFANEEVLLEKAAERPWFGWGIWGRNRVYNLDQGVDLSITDGTWIIVIGCFGWVGYVAMFGLLAFPALRVWRFYRGRVQVPAATAAVAVLMTINLLDLIPNSTMTPMTWLLAGSLLVPRPKKTAPALPLADAAADEAVAHASAGAPDLEPVPAR